MKNNLLIYNQIMTERSAGAITYTIADQKRSYMLIQDFHNNYGFPKGHLEENETDEEAAIREIREECGIDIRLDPYFKEELFYIMPNGKEKISVYFLGSFTDQKAVPQPEEVQKILFLSYEEAMKILTFNNMKEALRKAESYLNQ